MSAPISHIVFTEKVFNKYFSKFDHKEFILGTSFPDIRYLSNIEREKTHLKDCSFKDILSSKTSFKAGMRFHNLVDECRINFISEKFSVNELVKEQPSQTAVKAVEDKKLYHKINNWGIIINYFNTFPNESLTYGVQKEIIKKWFEIIQSYISNPVTINSVKKFMEALNYPKEKRVDVIESIIQFSKITNDAEYVLDFYNKFPNS